MIQLQTLNYILNTQDYSIITLNNIDKSYFPSYENEFNYIDNHYTKYGKIPDKTTFLETFPNFDIITVNEPKEYIIKELYKDKEYRYLTENYNKMRTLLMDNKIEEAHSLLNNLSINNSDFNYMQTVDILSDTSRYDNYIDKCNNLNNFFVKTGFNELDNFTGGWARNEELATIVGRPGIGKSYILFKCALTAAEQGLTVGLYEGEMTLDNVGYRLDSLISHISNGSLTHGNKNIQNDYKLHLSKIKDSIKGKLKILTPNMIGGQAKVSDLRAFIEKDNLDILFIDQYSLLDDDKGAKNPVERTSNISKDLKNLQVLKRIPIISASQQNREKEENGVDLRQIAQSDRIGQDSTTVLFLDSKDGILTIHLVKSRYSGGGKSLKYKIDYDKGLYIYIPEEDENNINQEKVEDLKLAYEPNNSTSGEDPF